MERMSSVVRTITKVAFGPIFIFGAYIILHGHLTPGGGFQGGALIASVMALYFVAFGDERWKKKLMSTLESIGLLTFASAGFLGLTAGFFFFNFLAGSKIPFFNEQIPSMEGFVHPNWAPLFSAGTVSVMNIAVGLEVVVGITLVVVAMGLFSFAGKEGE
ncbi:MAG: sodium:proton antiporter [Candidatus Thermoplasmatota archaeon]|jgi:multicomponent Na+:H+ antiporter subunit B|nr:sodium:proton antiporter [Candidatus Thermoplasmatota archaeon]